MELHERFREEVEVFVEALKSLKEHMLAPAKTGNMAWRLAEDLILITPTGVKKSTLAPQDLLFIDRTGEVIAGEGSPTGELPLYKMLFNSRPDIGSIIHCHSPYCCAVAISKGTNWLMKPLFAAVVKEIGPVPVVPYAEPRTEELARNLEPFTKKYNHFILEHHGLVTMSRHDIMDALMALELLEATAKSIFFALQSEGIKELSRIDVERLEKAMFRQGMDLVGAPGVNKSLAELYFND
jgi:L-fuculose-phosphate aldolase